MRKYTNIPRDEICPYHIRPGLWKHFKGNVYRVMFVTLHSDGTYNVVYERNNIYYSRPLSEWFDLREGVYRFVLLLADEPTVGPLDSVIEQE